MLYCSRYWLSAFDHACSGSAGLSRGGVLVHDLCHEEVKAGPFLKPEPWRGHYVARLLFLFSVAIGRRIVPIVLSDLAL